MKGIIDNHELHLKMIERFGNEVHSVHDHIVSVCIMTGLDHTDKKIQNAFMLVALGTCKIIAKNNSPVS